MSKFKGLVGKIVAVAVLLLGTAQAFADTIDFSNPAFAPIGKATSIPVGAAGFCKAHAADCAKPRKPVAAASLDDTRWSQLVSVNNAINTAVVPVTDEEYYKVSEYWTYPDGYGDCEDFALAKRKALIADGWSPSTLLMTVVRQPNGEGHAVLMVRTDRGDLVLDNQDGRILLWNETPYQFLKRQSQANPTQWVDLLDTRAQVILASK
jgi:predicted transglutaminase-like cysteine proteinase